MKAVTVKQPYADLIRQGLKTYEFRNLNTSYRGPIYIHASLQDNPIAMILTESLHGDIKRGVIVAKANLVDVIDVTEELKQKLQAENELVYGFRSCEHKYAWVLSDIQPIDSDIKLRGQLGLWNVIDEIEEEENGS